MYFKMKLIILIFYLSFGRCTDNVASINQETSQSSSIATMVSLLQLEETLFENLQNYVVALERKVHVLKMVYNKMNEVIIKAVPDDEGYLSNPLNSFALMRHMHQDWPKWLEFMTHDQIYNTRDSDHKMPTARDLNETITSMFLMQIIYDLEPKDIAVGLLNGKQYNSQLSSLDCFEMGRELYSQHKYLNAAKWLKVSVDRHSEDDLRFYEVSGFNLNNMYRMLEKAIFKQNRYTETAKNSKSNDTELSDPMIKPKMYFQNHIDGCRGKFKPKTSLHCRYNTTASPFLRLAPAKMEELELNPYMFLVHDMIYDNEIEELKRISIPELKRARIIFKGKLVEVDTALTAKYHFIPDNLTNTTKRINQRIADITGLDMNGSEELQMQNYGIGGHFEVHLDYFDAQIGKDVYKITESGDRIMTAVLYLSDVDQGGTTVFPFVDTAIIPRKGNVLFWYNLHNSGNNNILSAHGSCPMIVGSKWIATKWIRERAQIFRNKCYQYEDQ